MKSKTSKTILLCLSTVLVAGTAFAQADLTTPPTPQPGSPTGREFGHGMMRGGNDLRGSKINGAQIKSATGETLGTIDDVIINPRSGRIEFAALSVTGPTGTTPTGAGEKLTLVPWRLLNAQPGAGEQLTFTANVDQAKLSAAPSFDKNQWPDMSQSDWSQKYYSYFGLSREGLGGTGTGMEKGERGGTGPGTEKGAGAGGLQHKSDKY